MSHRSDHLDSMQTKATSLIQRNFEMGPANDKSLADARERLARRFVGLRSARDAGRSNCSRCRRLKVKCFYEDDEERCRRCERSDSSCLSKEVERRISGSRDTTETQNATESLQEVMKSLSRAKSPVVISTEMTDGPALETENGTRQAYPFEILGMAEPVTIRGDDATLTEPVRIIEGEQTSFDDYELSLYSRTRAALDIGHDYVYFQADCDYAHLKKTRPILTQVICTIGAGGDFTQYTSSCDLTKRQLLNVYYFDCTVNLDLLQSLLMAGEFFAPHNQRSHRNPLEYVSLAHQVAIDIGLYTNPRPAALYTADPFECDRTLLWLYFSHTLQLIGLRRASEQTMWQNAHAIASQRLSRSAIQKDRRLAKMMDLLPLFQKINELSTADSSGLLMDQCEKEVRILSESFESDARMLYSCISILIWLTSSRSHREDVLVYDDFEFEPRQGSLACATGAKGYSTV